MNVDKNLQEVVNKYNNSRDSSVDHEITPTVVRNANNLLNLLEANKLNTYTLMATPMGYVDFEFKTGKEILVLTAEGCDDMITLEQTPCGIFDPYVERFDLSDEASKDRLLRIVQEITA